MSITIHELATFRLGRQPSAGEDYERVELQEEGGCGACGAWITAREAYPARSGYWRCGSCIDPPDPGSPGEIFASGPAGAGYPSVEEANEEIFAGPERSLREAGFIIDRAEQADQEGDP